MVSTPARYLVLFQYFGTKYSGVMETSTNQSVIGVQNYLEKAAQNLKPVVPIKFHISSRTDAGVHALCNSAHLDIQRAPGKPDFDEKQLIRGLNRYLNPEPIRSLNVPAMRDAAQFLVGTHDFSTFRSLNSETPFQCPVRTMFQADIQPSSGFLSHHYEHRGLEFWELKFRGRSFLYRQRGISHDGTVHTSLFTPVALGQGLTFPELHLLLNKSLKRTALLSLRPLFPQTFPWSIPRSEEWLGL
ncbi:tRNA pseudouridine synthase-like 1 isoform X6 [Tyto alba]|uniref:tRNA pseudouridine synthase-like 1 isoform X6 n=1 Tax=Tyto alba TaxID=56313 RepID=UPI00140224C6|nr:tRNA pseudouridine synthase-like 1 isoform X6 [Tyto alba]